MEQLATIPNFEVQATCYFPVAAVVNYHKLSDLKQPPHTHKDKQTKENPTFIILQLWRSDV